MILDFHVHVYPDDIAPRAVESLYNAYSFSPFTDGTEAGLMDSMADAGIDLCVTQPVATKPSQVATINDLAISNINPKLIAFGTVHAELSNLVDEVDRLIASGIKGIKIQGNWQGFAVNDPRLYPAYEAASGKLVVMYHAGKEIVPLQNEYASPALIADVKRKFPNLDIVAAHMGGFRMWKESWEYLVGSNVYLDTSSSMGYGMEAEEFVQMINRHGIDKILFATDSPLIDQKAYLNLVMESGLSDDDLEKILWKNGAELLDMVS